MTDRNIHDVLDELENPTPEKELEWAETMTDEEVLADLKAMGVDVDKQDAKARKWYADIQSSTRREASAKPEHTRWQVLRPWFGGGGIGALAAAALLAILVSTSSIPLVVVHPSTLPTAVDPPNPDAPYLRHRALDYCMQKNWGRCLDELDDAESRDLPGDANPAIRALRATAMEGLAAGKDGG